MIGRPRHSLLVSLSFVFGLFWMSLLSAAPAGACHGMAGWSYLAHDGHWIGTGSGGRLDLEVDHGVLDTMDFLGFSCGGTTKEVWGYPGCPVGGNGSFSQNFTAQGGESVQLSGTFDMASSSGTAAICVNGCCKTVAVRRIGVLEVYAQTGYGVDKAEITPSGAEDAYCSWDDEDTGSIRLHREYFGDTIVTVTAQCREGLVLSYWNMGYLPNDVPQSIANALVDNVYANPVVVTLKAGVWLDLTPICVQASAELSADRSNPTKKMTQTVAPGTPVNLAANHIRISPSDKDIVVKNLLYAFEGDGVMAGFAGGGLLNGAKLHKDPSCTGESAGMVGEAGVSNNQLKFGKINTRVRAGDSYCYLLLYKLNNKALGTYGARIRPGDVTAVDAATKEKIAVGGSPVAGSLEVNLDTDGDALLDHWEKYGYDHDGDGVVDVDLPAMGADLKHKDLFVEIDWMKNASHTHKPKSYAMKKVVRAFKNAPVENPDGIQGITLHLDTGDLGGGNGVPHVSDLKPLWAKFDAIKNDHFDPKRARIFRYCLFGHNYNSTASSGYSRSIPGSDFVVTLGSWDGGVGTSKQQAGTFMHELGHTLGLRHGGNDNVLYKPNFLSIMNYFFQMDWLRYDGTDNKLDYSRFVMKSLNEEHLDEEKALEADEGDEALAKYGTRFYSTDGNARVRNNCSANVDWDGNADITTDTSVDLNHDGNLSVLRGNCNEWLKIQFKGGAVGSTGFEPARLAVEEEPADVDLTVEEYRRMKAASIPVP